MYKKNLEHSLDSVDAISRTRIKFSKGAAASLSVSESVVYYIQFCTERRATWNAFFFLNTHTAVNARSLR